MRRLDPGLVLLKSKTQASLHWGLDGRAADLAVPLGSMPVATAEEGAGNLYGEVETRPRGDVLAVDVASPVHIAWLGALDCHGAKGWVCLGGVEVSELGGSGAWVDQIVEAIFEVEVELGA
ncbi:hypothetical protein E5D57_011499 [Metarhizium anisopliae]|nr:hypothetical protein E5D57_011499 [Metarhizium anisopliae]